MPPSQRAVWKITAGCAVPFMDFVDMPEGAITCADRTFTSLQRNSVNKRVPSANVFLRGLSAFAATSSPVLIIRMCLAPRHMTRVAEIQSFPSVAARGVVTVSDRSLIRGARASQPR